MSISNTQKPQSDIQYAENALKRKERDMAPFSMVHNADKNDILAPVPRDSVMRVAKTR
jgi:hypothetical protein